MKWRRNPHVERRLLDSSSWPPGKDFVSFFQRDYRLTAIKRKSTSDTLLLWKRTKAQHSVLRVFGVNTMIHSRIHVSSWKRGIGWSRHRWWNDFNRTTLQRLATQNHETTRYKVNSCNVEKIYWDQTSLRKQMTRAVASAAEPLCCFFSALYVYVVAIPLCLLNVVLPDSI